MEAEDKTVTVNIPEDRITHYSNADGWFYVLDNGNEVGPFETEWEMFKYVEDIDINEKPSAPDDAKGSKSSDDVTL